MNTLVHLDQMRPESGCISSHYGFHDLQVYKQNENDIDRTIRKQHKMFQCKRLKAEVILSDSERDKVNNLSLFQCVTKSFCFECLYSYVSCCFRMVLIFSRLQKRYSANGKPDSLH